MLPPALGLLLVIVRLLPTTNVNRWALSNCLLFPHPEPIPFIDGPVIASSRSWTPSNGPTVVWPATGAKTNAGQLAYQLQDAARASASAAAASRQAKSLIFPLETVSVSSISAQHRQQQPPISSEFRPSPVFSFNPVDTPAATTAAAPVK